MSEDIKKDLFDLNYSSNFDIAGNQEVSIDIQLTDSVDNSCSITGIVLDSENKPVEGATIKIFDSEGTPYLHTITDVNGEYTFSGLKDGSYYISCVKDKIILTVPQQIFLYKNEVKTFNFSVRTEESLNLCSITGDVYKNEGSETFAGAIVSLLDATTRATVASTLTADDGEFLFYDVQAGDYIITATSNGYKKSQDVSITAIDNELINIDLRLFLNPEENLGTVSGVITNNGNVVANAIVGLYRLDENNKEKLIAITKTNAEGIYMFGKVAGGKYKVKSKQNNS